MKELQATIVLFTLFALRCIAPLLVTLGIGYMMNRIVNRWEAEEAETAATQSQTTAPTLSASSLNTSLNLPCWILKNCGASCQNCPAYLQPDIPCWQARIQKEGALPVTCTDCSLYTNRLAPA